MTAVWRTDLDSFALTLCHKRNNVEKKMQKYISSTSTLWQAAQQANCGEGGEGGGRGSSLQGLVQICIADPSEFVAGDK